MLASLALGFTMLLATGPDPRYQAEIEAWRARRVASLTSAEGWLTVVGLFWLEPGENSVGSSPNSRVTLPPGKAPGTLGSIRLEGNRASFRAAPGVAVAIDGKPAENAVLLPDSAERPTRVSSGPILFYLIERGGRLAVRVKDASNKARAEFHGIDSYAIDPSWRIEARFEPYDPPRSVSVPNVLGHDDSEASPGALVFEHAGKSYRLDAVLEKGETDYFVIFGDKTNGKETYGAGRFLYVSPPVGGKTILDFNKAYNPPCVFTAYATCPLPPPQNKLPIPVTAGEKAYEEGH